MLKKLLMVVAMSAATTAFAGDVARDQAKEVIELKDGSTLYVFKDGKMAVEDKLGRAINVKKGTVVEAKDGRKIVVEKGATVRLDSMLKEGHL